MIVWRKEVEDLIGLEECPHRKRDGGTLRNSDE